MKYILVVISPPKSKQPLATQKWSKVNNMLRSSVEPCEGAEILSEGAVLIPASSGLPLLATAISAAEEQELSYRVLFVENATEWKRDFNGA